jgi:hypothetical protein
VAKSTITTLGTTAYSVQALSWKFPLANVLHAGTTGANNSLLSSRPAGTYSNLRGKCNANTTSAASTLRFEDGGAASACVVSITAGSTGAFEDISNTESVTDGATGVFTYYVSSGTGTSTLTIAQIDFEPTDNTKTVTVFGTAGAPSTTTASATYYHGISGNCHISNTTTEANTQFQFKKSCTLKNWRVRVLTDGRTGNTTYRLRKNGANAAQSISTSATGLFEDTTNTDSIVADDKVNVQVVLPSGNQAVSWTATAVNAETTDNISFMGACAGGTANANATTYLNYGYTLTSNTLANTQIKLYRDAVVGNLSLYLSANTINGSTTIRLNDDGTDINPQVSVSSSTSGLFADTSNTATVAANSLLTPVIIAGGSTGTLTITALLHEVRPGSTLYNKPISESTVSVSEALARVQVILKPISEPSVSVIEALARIQLKINAISESAISVSEALARIPTYVKAISESAITTNDSVARLPLYIRPISETAISNVSDSIARWISVSYTLAEPSISVNDSVQGALFYLRTISDTPAITTDDSIVRLLSAVRTVAAEPSISVSDTIERIQTILKAISESAISVNDSVQGSLLYTALIIESRIKWYYSVLTRKVAGA